MNDNRRTLSMLQRLPVILAVTAASYGLPTQSPRAQPGDGVARHHTAGHAASSALERMREDVALQD